MIGRLRGEVVELAGHTVVVDCGGVGYEVILSGHSLAALPPAGETVTLRIFTHAQENKIVLYGFATPEERELFDLLITVKNVGPASAVKILSAGAGPAEIARMIANDQVSLLTSLRGVGKKTAELLVVELRDKCEALALAWSVDRHGVPLAPPAPRRQPILDEVQAALVQLGWRPAEADKAVSGLAIEGASLEGLLRQALRAMPR